MKNYFTPILGYTKIISTTFFVAISIFSFSQNFNWIKTGYRTDCNNGVYPVDVAADNAGNIISTGYYYATTANQIDFDGMTLQGYTSGSFESSAFIAKYNPTGTIQWLKRVGTNFMDGNYPRVDADASGNIYAGIALNGTVGVSGASADIAGTTIPSGVFVSDAVLVKFSAAGNVTWYKHFSGYGSVNIYDVKTDAAGDVYVTGNFNGSLNVGGASFTGSNGTNSNFFIAKFSAAGNLVWFKNATGTGTDAGYKLFVKGGNVYVLGVFAETNSDTDMTLNGTTYTIPNANYDATFVAKYSSSGSLVWFKHGYLQDAGTGGNGPSPNYCDIVVDANDNVYTVHSLSHSAAGVVFAYSGSPVTYTCIGTGGADYIMTKYSSSGTLMWAKGDGASTPNGNCFPTSMIINANAQLLVSYMISATVAIDNVSITSAGSEDAVLARFDMNGNLKCHKQYGGSNQDWAMDMEPTINGGVAYTGHVFGTTTSALITTYDGINMSGCRNTGITGLIKSPAIAYNSPICAYASSATVTLLGGATLGTFSSSPAGLTINPTNGTITPSSSTPGTYTVSMTGTIGCDSIITTTVTITTTLTTTINASICSWDIYTLPGGGQTVNVSGTYIDTLMSMGGCDSVVIINLTVEPAINLTISQNGNTLVANASNANSYQWFNCNTLAIIPGAINQSYTPSTSGSYGVLITNNGCTDTSNCVNLTVGLAETNFENTIQLFPNPTTNNVTIAFDKNVQNANIRLFNIYGQLVFQKNNVSGNRFIMDISEQSAGIYFIEIDADGEVAKMKVIKK